MSGGRRREFVYRSRREAWAVISLQYIVEEASVLNHGREGTIIRKGVDRFSKREVALKIVPVYSREVNVATRTEVETLTLLNPHQHIVEYIESYHTPEEVVIVLELCTGGDLLDEVNRTGPLGEDRARAVMLQCISGLRHMHLLGVSHRDIKLENLLLTNDQMVKLADFGFASRYLPGQLLTDSRGTLAYAAPEMLLPRGQVLAVPEMTDVWSLGVVLFGMLYGALPFEGEDDTQLVQNISRRRIKFPCSAASSSVSSEAQELVLKMLSTNPRLRPKLSELISHPWIVNEITSSSARPTKRPCSRNVPDGIVPTAQEQQQAEEKKQETEKKLVFVAEKNPTSGGGSQNPSPERPSRQQNRPTGPLPAPPPASSVSPSSRSPQALSAGSKRAHTPLVTQAAAVNTRPLASAPRRGASPLEVDLKKKEKNVFFKSLLRPFDFLTK